jgi:hypothetical protein
MANGTATRPNPFREFLFLAVGFVVCGIVGQSFDDTVAQTRKDLKKKQGNF